MPNYCDNELGICGTKDDIKLFKERAAGENGILDMNNFVRYPVRFKNQDEIRNSTLNELMTEAGIPEVEMEKTPVYLKINPLLPSTGYSSGGYHWCLENWGTKWNFRDPSIEFESDTNLFYRFYTAWSPPLPVIKKMGETFPALTFELRYFEGGMGFNGIFLMENGTIQLNNTADYYGHRGG